MESAFLESSIQTFRSIKGLGDNTLAQINEAELTWSPDPEVNSLAVLVQHVAGNMFSRWTDFLTTDGEKPTRNRDGEFELSGTVTKAGLLDLWERGWGCTFAALEALKPEDVLREVTIYGKTHTVIEALHRQISHYGSHVGQMAMLGKMLRGKEWQTLSIPRKPR